MTQTLTTIGHIQLSTMSNIVSNKRHRNDIVKKYSNEKINEQIYVKKMNEKQVCNT